jgi:hypothetical protein
MKAIWVFGDSFTDRYILSNNKSYIDWKGYTPKTYHEILGEKLDSPIKNFSESYGMDNYTIFQTLCDNINEINQDIVIINWSEPVRFRLVDYVSQKWRTVLPLKSTRVVRGLPYVNGVKDETVLDTFTNRENHLWLTEIDSWVKIINKALSDSIVIHWTWHNNTQFQTITEETKGEVIDFHYSEKGHIDLSNWILDQIKIGTNKSPYKQNSIL